MHTRRTQYSGQNNEISPRQAAVFTKVLLSKVGERQKTKITSELRDYNMDTADQNAKIRSNLRFQRWSHIMGKRARHPNISGTGRGSTKQDHFHCETTGQVFLFYHQSSV